MPRPRRQDVYEGIQTKIKETAWQVLAETGASGGMMREIARRMELTAPALYNYYASRDELLTALIVEGFTELAQSMQMALAQETIALPKIQAMLRAYQTWATTYPTKYYLIYGTPIPGYHAPREITVPAAVGIFATLVQPLEEAFQQGELIPTAPYDAIPAAQLPIIEALIAQNHYPVTPLMVYLGFVMWGELYKLVMPALLHHYMPLDTAVLFETETHALLKRIGFRL